MAGDEYFASKGSLKLKGVAESGIKKKKKKKKEIEKEMAASIRRNTSPNSTPEKEAPNVAVIRNYTEAERRFMERQRKMEADRILKKASKTHKEKVEDFNRHLDSLTEHFDIPKVSWTKWSILCYVLCKAVCCSLRYFYDITHYEYQCFI